MGIINKTNLIKLLVVWFPIGFLSIRHSIHISLYAIFLLFVYELINKTTIIAPNKKLIITATSLGSILIATILQQSITLKFNLSAWDGPSRLFIAGLALLYLQQKNINYAKLLEIAIPLGLITLYIYLSYNHKYFWEHRWANVFVDPNSLGGQCTILSMLCLLSLTPKLKSYTNIVKILGATAGLYISIKSESRGGWIAMPFMTVCWLAIQVSRARVNSNKFQILNQLGIFFIIIAAAATLVISVDSVQNRLSITIYEISTWFRDPTIYTSAGARMSMWVTSLQLISENPFGYGEIAIKEILTNHPLHKGIHLNGVRDMITAGPHSDILSKGLSLGVLGIASYLLIIFVPATLFTSKITSQDAGIREAAHIGLIYVVGVFIVGLFNETLSLKYLCSFYGLMIACLAGQILHKSSMIKTE